MWEATVFDAPAAKVETCKQRAESRGNKAENTCPILTKHTRAALLTGSDSAKLCASQRAVSSPPSSCAQHFNLNRLINPWLFNYSQINTDKNESPCCYLGNSSSKRITIFLSTFFLPNSSRVLRLICWKVQWKQLFFPIQSHIMSAHFCFAYSNVLFMCIVTENYS